jgi:hypothetical protein
MASEVQEFSTKARIMRNVSIVLTLLLFSAVTLPRFMGLSITPASAPILGLFVLLVLLSWTIFWQLRYGWVWMLVLTGGLIALLTIAGGANSRAVGQLVGFLGLLALSFWVSSDAKKRGMSGVWGLWVLLLAVVFVPVYFLIRRPVGEADGGGLVLLGLEDKTTEAPAIATVKCTSCGHEFAASLSSCEQCGHPIAKTHSATA